MAGGQLRFDFFQGLNIPHISDTIIIIKGLAMKKKRRKTEYKGEIMGVVSSFMPIISIMRRLERSSNPYNSIETEVLLFYMLFFIAEKIIRGRLNCGRLQH
jgi:hypothetical protein